MPQMITSQGASHPTHSSYSGKVIPRSSPETKRSLVRVPVSLPNRYNPVNLQETAVRAAQLAGFRSIGDSEAGRAVLLVAMAGGVALPLSLGLTHTLIDPPPPPPPPICFHPLAETNSEMSVIHRKKLGCDGLERTGWSERKKTNLQREALAPRHVYATNDKNKIKM